MRLPPSVVSSSVVNSSPLQEPELAEHPGDQFLLAVEMLAGFRSVLQILRPGVLHEILFPVLYPERLGERRIPERDLGRREILRPEEAAPAVEDGVDALFLQRRELGRRPRYYRRPAEDALILRAAIPAVVADA